VSLLSQANHLSIPQSDLSSLCADAPAEEDDEDIDLFGDDDEEDAEAERVKAERVAAYAAKKATKPKTAAKSVVTFEVKPWDDETDMVALENAVRSIEMDGLVWGASKLVAVGYGIKKLQVTIVIGSSTGLIAAAGANLFRL
jgi:elongation factor 1-beta